MLEEEVEARILGLEEADGVETVNFKDLRNGLRCGVFADFQTLGEVALHLLANPATKEIGRYVVGILKAEAENYGWEMRISAFEDN